MRRIEKVVEKRKELQNKFEGIIAEPEDEE